MAAIAAAPIIWLCWFRVVDKAGFTGPVLGVIVWVAVTGTAILGAGWPRTFGPLDDRVAAIMVIGISGTAVLWIVYEVLTD